MWSLSCKKPEWSGSCRLVRKCILLHCLILLHLMILLLWRFLSLLSGTYGFSKKYIHTSCSFAPADFDIFEYSVARLVSPFCLLFIVFFCSPLAYICVLGYSVWKKICRKLVKENTSLYFLTMIMYEQFHWMRYYTPLTSTSFSNLNDDEWGCGVRRIWHWLCQ